MSPQIAALIAEAPICLKPVICLALLGSEKHPTYPAGTPEVGGEAAGDDVVYMLI